MDQTPPPGCKGLKGFLKLSFYSRVLQVRTLKKQFALQAAEELLEKATTNFLFQFFLLKLNFKLEKRSLFFQYLDKQSKNLVRINVMLRFELIQKICDISKIETKKNLFRLGF